MVALCCYCFTPKCSTRNSVEISGWWALVQSKEQWIQFLEEQGALWGSLGFPAVHQKKRWAFKKGKLMEDIWLGDVINMRLLNANEHRYIIDME